MIWDSGGTKRNTEQVGVAVCCSVLQCVAVCCSVLHSVLQCVAVALKETTHRKLVT